jgi:polysaccharide export outer membrane protein
VAHLNLNDSRSIRSPFFQLQQNDLVYVEPNKGRGLSGEIWTIITPIITSILTLLVIIVSNLLR